MTAILLSLSNLKKQVQLLSKHKWSYFELFCIQTIKFVFIRKICMMSSKQILTSDEVEIQ